MYKLPLLSNFHQVLVKLIIILIGLYSIAATYVLIKYDVSKSLFLIYEIICLLSIIVLINCKRDIFSPHGLAVIFYFITFIAPVPLLVTIENTLLSLDISSEDLVRTVSLSFLALISFLAGSEIRINKSIIGLSKIIPSQKKLIPAGNTEFLFIMIWLIIGAVIRLVFKIGVAGVQSNLEYGKLIGIIQYVFMHGSLVLIGLFWARSCDRGPVAKIQFFTLSAILTFTQLLLGWRSGIKEIMILVFIIYWYRRKENIFDMRFIIVIISILLTIPLSFNLGSKWRATNLGSEAEKYAENSMGFLQSIAFRSDGHTRFAGVLAHETGGNKLSWFNDFKIFELMNEGISTNRYADLEIWGVHLDQIHSTGSSGPGGAYIGLGIMGIIIGYLLIGAFYGTVYRIMYSAYDTAPSIVLYAILAIDLPKLFSEHFTIVAMAKQYLIITIVLIIVTRLLYLKRFERKLVNESPQFA